MNERRRRRRRSARRARTTRRMMENSLWDRRPMMQIRVGFEMVYECPQPTPMIFNLNVHFTRAADLVGRDDLVVDPSVPIAAYRDIFGNWCTRIVAPSGRTRVSGGTLVNDTG